jgi:iron(II)-dependent oxidoreductase
MERFSDEELEAFTFDFFKAVHANFGASQSKGHKVSALLEYAQGHDELFGLVAALRQSRPDQFDARFPQLLVNNGSPDDAEFCLVPGGDFWLGDEGGDEQPAQIYTGLQEEYWMARTPVTVAHYQAYVAATHRPFQNAEALLQTLDLPVVCVTWYDAQAYADWLTQTWQASGKLPLGWRVRLPTEPEWEKAARGGLKLPQTATVMRARELLFNGALGSNANLSLMPNLLPQRSYPWGDIADPSKANYADTEPGALTPVGRFAEGATPYGCIDMVGNAWEWTASVYQPYPYAASDGREDMHSSAARVIRGGAYFSFDQFIRCSTRYSALPSKSYNFIGFRIVIARR